MNKDKGILATAQPAERPNSTLEQPVTLFRGIKPEPTGFSTLGELFDRMRTSEPGKREAVLALRQLATEAKSTGNEKAYKDQKEQLAGYSLGKWNYRADAPENCLQYVPVLVLDFDFSVCYDSDAPPFSPEICREVFEKVCKAPHTFAAFLAPGGGLRVLVVADCNYHNHRETYGLLMAHYCQVSGLPVLTSKKVDGKKKTNAPFGIDSVCQNESRFFYMVEGLTADEFYLKQIFYHLFHSHHLHQQLVFVFLQQLLL